jgi:hypothetical protein
MDLPVGPGSKCGYMSNCPDETLQQGVFCFVLVGWDLRHQVLRPLLAYCTAPDDR